MKKVIRFMGIIAFAALIGFSLAACGGDDDNPGPIPDPGPGPEPYVPVPDPVPKITMTTTVSGSTHIYLLGTGEATIDWGDGSPTEDVTLTSSNDVNDLSNNDFNHSYGSDAEKTITVTGNVTGFSSNGEGIVSSLNVSGCPGLKYIQCNSENLTALDLSKNTVLEYLDCDDNHLTVLDLSKNTKLVELYCGNNDLASLNISGCTELETVYCDNNELEADALSAILYALPDRFGLDIGVINVVTNPGIHGTGYDDAKAAAELNNWNVGDST